MSNLLLDVLRNDLNQELDPAMEAISNEYLNELLTNDELLSMDQYTTTTTNSENLAATSSASAASGRNIVEEIAELDLQERSLNLELSSITYKNKDIIVDVSSDLQTINKLLFQEFAEEVNSMEKAVTTDPSTTPSLKSTLSVNINEKIYKTIETNNNILSNIDSILDLLELPSLCKLCILQGNYQESLEISMLVQSLLIRFPGVYIFHQINQQVETELKLMVKGLLKLLNTNLKQNNILKIFQILNKLDLIQSSDSTETKKLQKEKYLKIIYLNSRFKFIVNELNSLQPLIKFNKLTYLKRYIEIYREHIFSTLSIYHAIFTAAKSSSTSSAVSSASSSDDDTLLINQFIRNLVALLTTVFKTYYNEIDDTSASTPTKEEEIEKVAHQDGLLLQIIYLCKSLAKYHVDFESVIIWDLCYSSDLITEADWKRNLKKVKKFKS